MRTEETPWYRLLAPIVGFDESGDDADDDGDDNDDTDDADDEDEQDDDGADGSESEKKDDTDEAANLRKALRAERRAHRQTQKEARKLARESGSKDKDRQAEQLTAENQQLREQTDRLASALARQAVDSVLVRLAGKMNFRDIDDAMRLVDREDIDLDQDDEDVSKVQVDEKSVEDALAELAKSKPHLIKGETEDLPNSGGQFGGKKKDKDGLTDDVLRERYPALRK